jgi:hypothetical protein
MQNVPGGSVMFQMDFRKKIKSFALKTCFGAQAGCGDVISTPYTKTWSKTPKPNFYRLPIQEPIFSLSNTEFEGGCDGRGCGDCIFLAK